MNLEWYVRDNLPEECYDPTTMDAAIYARISDDTEGRAAGVRRQVEDATSLAERMGWTLTLPPFIDNDISASTRSSAKRPAFEDMLARVERGEVEAIAYYSSSRLTRRPLEFETIISLVERTGVRLASVASGNADLTTADGRMVARILAAQDAAEAERIGERVKRAFDQRIAEGKPYPSSRAFGFEAGGVQIVEEEAALIQQAAQRIAHEGWSMGQVVQDWNERGVPTVRGAKWSRTQVRRALLSPRTAGLLSKGGVILGKGDFGQILSPELQREVQAALDSRRRGVQVTYRERKHVLAGFLVCGRCDHQMKVNALLEIEGDGSLRSDSFVTCGSCHGVKRNLKVLNEYVDKAVTIRLESWQPVGEGDALEEDAEAVAALEAELGTVLEDLADLKAAFEAGTMRFRDYNASLSALRTREEALQGALNARLVQRHTPEDLSALEAWHSDDLGLRRGALAQVVDHIKLLPVGRVGPKRMREAMDETTRVKWVLT